MIHCFYVPNVQFFLNLVKHSMWNTIVVIMLSLELKYLLNLKIISFKV